MAAAIAPARSSATAAWPLKPDAPRGARALAVEFRLAPEHPFPAAYDDALAAWRFLREQGFAARQIAVGGDSAGGGLTLALLMRLRDLKEALPACAWLVSPWTDLTLSGETLATKDDADPLLHKAYLEELAQAYVPAGVDRHDPRVSPLFGDLRGLPPLHDSGGLKRNAACRFDATCRGGRRRRRLGHAGDLAAHDPCVALMECKA